MHGNRERFKENRCSHGADSAGLLESALDFIRRACRSGEALAAGSSGQNIAARREREIAALRDWATTSGARLNATELLAQSQPGGVEHELVPGDGTEPIRKITYRFGLTVDLDFRLGKQSQRWLAIPIVREATPLEYLERIRLFTEVFAVGWCLDGIIEQSNKVRIVTSQPFIRGHAASSEQIRNLMLALGFQRVIDVTAGREDSTSYFRNSDRVAVFDAHGENFIRTRTDVIPIVALVITVGDPLAAYLEMPPTERIRELGLSHRPKIR